MPGTKHFLWFCLIVSQKLLLFDQLYFLATTLESGINVPLVYYFFEIFSRGYGLITDLKDLKEYFPNLLESALLHQIFVF